MLKRAQHQRTQATSKPPPYPTHPPVKPLILLHFRYVQGGGGMQISTIPVRITVPTPSREKNSENRGEKDG